MADRDGEKPRLQQEDAYTVNKGSPRRGLEETAAGGVTASASDIKQKVTEDIRAVSGFAKEQAGSIANKAKDVAEEQKGYIAHKVGSVASAMEKAAAALDDDDPALGKMARNVGSTVRKLSDDMKGRSLGEVAAMTEDFGRKQPLAFLGIAAAAGLAVSRFLTASPPTARLSDTSSRRVDEPAKPVTPGEG